MLLMGILGIIFICLIIFLYRGSENMKKASLVCSILLLGFIILFDVYDGEEGIEIYPVFNIGEDIIEFEDYTYTEIPVEYLQTKFLGTYEGKPYGVGTTNDNDISTDYDIYMYDTYDNKIDDGLIFNHTINNVIGEDDNFTFISKKGRGYQGEQVDFTTGEVEELTSANSITNIWKGNSFYTESSEGGNISSQFLISKDDEEINMTNGISKHNLISENGLYYATVDEDLYLDDKLLDDDHINNIVGAYGEYVVYTASNDNTKIFVYADTDSGIVKSTINKDADCNPIVYENYIVSQLDGEVSTYDIETMERDTFYRYNQEQHFQPITGFDDTIVFENEDKFMFIDIDDEKVIKLDRNPDSTYTVLTDDNTVTLVEVQNNTQIGFYTMTKEEIFN